MSSFWKSTLDRCPVCEAPIEVAQGPISNRLVCYECRAELVIRPKHLKRLAQACIACGFLLAIFGNSEVPFFLTFSAYTVLSFLILRLFVSPFLPHELRPAHKYIQDLRIDDSRRKQQ